MGGAPILEQVRPGVIFTPEAAASFRRLERRCGRELDANSTYRAYGLQLRWHLESIAYENGGPYPGHSRAIHPDESKHCLALAWDTDEWVDPAFVALAAEYGWIRTAAWDPTEQHHFEYQIHRDQHLHDPAPESEEDDMTPEQSKKLDAVYAAIYGARNLTDQPDEISWVNRGGDVQKAAYGLLPIEIHTQEIAAQALSEVKALRAELAKAKADR